jgi:hypothetical protein
MKKILIISLFIQVLIQFLPVNAQQLNITNFKPWQNAVIDTSQKSIAISFDTPVDTNNLKEHIRILGSYTALRDYDYSFSATDCTLFILPKTNYYFGEKVTVIVTSFLRGAGGESFSGFQWEFYIKPGVQSFPYFTQPTIYPQFGGFDLIPADINDDGYPDIILDSGQILENDGQGNFSLYQQLNYPGSLALNIRDSDLDRYKEIILNPYVYEQQIDGFFYLDTTLKPAHSDFNNDGYPELVKFGIIPPGDTINYIGLIYSDGIGGYNFEIDTIVVDLNIMGVLNSSDFNNDGIRDIAYVTNVFATPYGVGGENKLAVLYMNVNGDTSYSFVVHYHQFPGGNMGFLFELWANDFNNDSFQDILLITNVEDLIVFNDGIGGFLTNENDFQLTGGGDLKHSATIADINGDGWLGLVYNYRIGANELALTSIVRNDSGDFSYRPWIYSKSWADVHYSTTADFNGDGALDIATTWYDGLYIHFNSDVNNIEDNKRLLPKNFYVYDNFPNPFNSSTNIQFEIFSSLILEIKIFNINGKEVKEYQKKKYLPGKYNLKWDGNNESGKEVSSGIYFWSFKSEDFFKTKKILLVK